MGRIKKWIFAGGIASILISGLMIVMILFTIQAAISVVGGQENSSRSGGSDASVPGLPSLINEEMVVALLEMQDEYGHPASTGLAQIIKESSGDYGPGLSQLAYEDKNLFGIYWWSNDPYAIGSHAYVTGEQNPDGSSYSTTVDFSVYASYTDCIRCRAWKLEHSPFVEHIEAYKKTGNSYSKEQANSFLRGLREGGWATDLSYIADCLSIMETYDLYRFDTMTRATYLASGDSRGSGETGSGQEYSSATAAQRAIVDTAYATPFAGDGLCATWVSRVFANAGQSYPYGNANSFTMTRESGGIKVGMAIAVEHSGSSSDSWNYGHIGIYIGDGKVMHNESSRTGNCSNGCTITALDQWLATYEYQCTAYYGWVNGIDLSQ